MKVCHFILLILSFRAYCQEVEFMALTDLKINDTIPLSIESNNKHYAQLYNTGIHIPYHGICPEPPEIIYKGAIFFLINDKLEFRLTSFEEGLYISYNDIKIDSGMTFKDFKKLFPKSAAYKEDFELDTRTNETVQIYHLAYSGPDTFFQKNYQLSFIFKNNKIWSLEFEPKYN